MRVKVDEDLPRAATKLLRGRGLDTLTVIEQGMGGFKDPALWGMGRPWARYCEPTSPAARVDRPEQLGLHGS